jgi:hypothetical protein
MTTQFQHPVVLLRSECVVDSHQLVVVCGYQDNTYGYAIMWEGGDVVSYHPKVSESTYQQVLAEFSQLQEEYKR